jgi:hypothetical protein
VKTLLSLTFSILCITVATSSAVILFDDGNPNVNTTAPVGTVANNAWQFEGNWGAFLGTAIAPHYFISAAHIGQAGSDFSYAGVTYTIAQSYALADSDLLIWRVNETLPTYAPLYTHLDEEGKHLVVIGRGTERGGAISLDNTERGWSWGAQTYVRRWGENDVADILPYQGHSLIYSTFDNNGAPNECHLSVGDSGGAVFLNDNGTWKLAGINFAVDDLFTTPNANTQFEAAIFDARGYYEYDGHNFILETGNAPVPTGFYASRIASELAWIGSVIAEPQVGREANFLTLTYTRIVASSTDVVYSIEQSTDLTTWTPATSEDEILTNDGALEVVRSKVATAAMPLFIELRVKVPSLEGRTAPVAPQRVAASTGSGRSR